MRRFFLTVSLSALIVSTGARSATNGKRVITPEDYTAFETAADPRISPDGKSVAYTVTGIDAKQNRKRTTIWVVALDGSGKPRQLTTEQSSNAPRWSPDGQSLSYLASRQEAGGAPAAASKKGASSGASSRGSAQVWLLPFSGGEPRQITKLKGGVTAYQWSPDGSRLVCLSSVTPAETPGKEPSDVKHYLYPAYKMDGRGFLDGRRTHIFVVDVKSGAATQLTSDDLRNEGDPQWSPDGTRIAFTSSRIDSVSGARGEGLMVMPASGGIPSKVSDLELGLSRPRWSPDGKRLAYVASSDEAMVPKMWVVSSAGGGKSTPLAGGFTYATELDWSGDGHSIFFSGAYRGEDPVFRTDVKSGKLTQLTSGAIVKGADFNEKTHTMAYVAGDTMHPGNVWAADLSGRNARQLTHLNEALLSELDLAPVERLTYKAADGWEIDGFFMKPLGWEPGKSYPMITSVHGGPNGMYSTGWSQDFQLYAAHGWAVFFTNPRGSSGYGEKFQRGVFKEWGGKTYQDIQTGVDTMLAKYSWIDRDRLGFTGHSFGGFMTDWTVGQTTRFKAAVTLAGISDLVSVEGTRDGYYGHARDFGGDLFENFDLYWKYSPIRNARNVKTPTLIIHGDADQRVPLEQGEQFFRALKRFGVTSEFVIFPGEAHSLRSTPKHTVELMKWEIYWFDRFLNGNEAAVRP